MYTQKVTYKLEYTDNGAIISEYGGNRWVVERKAKGNKDLVNFLGSLLYDEIYAMAADEDSEFTIEIKRFTKGGEE